MHRLNSIYFGLENSARRDFVLGVVNVSFDLELELIRQC